MSWITTELKNVTVKIGSGSTPRGGAEAYKESGISLIRSQNILDLKFSEDGLAFIDDRQAESLKNVTVEENDVLLNITGDSVARCCGAPKNFLPARVNQHVAILRADKSKLNSDFLKYYLFDAKEQLLVFSEIGGTRNALTKNMLENFSICLPPLPEQQAIASVLSALDDKIDLLQRQNQTLEQMAATLFRQWFIEEAKEDWEEVRVSDIAIHIKNSINPNKFPTTLFKHFSLPAFDNGQNPSIESGQEILSSKYQLESNSILVSKLNPIVPRVWMILKADNNFISSTEFQNFKPKNRNYLGFLYFLFKADTVIEQLAMSASGTSGSHQRVKPQDMLDIKFTTSNLNLVEKFSLMVESTLIKQHENLKQIRTLQSMRDTLLPKLISGEVRLKGFETVLQA